MRVVFMGTPDFAVPVLNALVDAGHDVVRVYSQPPRRAGRGKQVRRAPVHTAAEARGIPVATPDGFRDLVIDGFVELRPDIAIVVAYGQILPQAALDVPRLGCLNLHASLLPRWRGAAPIQRAIMAGDPVTGVCVMQMDAGLDTGPVLARETVPIAPDETAATLHDRLAAISARLIVQTLPNLHECRAEPQPLSGVTYAAKIDKREARIDWCLDAPTLGALIRGLSPFPGAWCDIGGTRVKVLMASLAEGSGPPGAVLDDRLCVACGAGALRLTLVQPAGKSAMPAAAFLSGRPVTAGTLLD
ncbi:MAG: methionyl-tRNA formyltransferase [Pseudomonadota bacterium]